MAQQERAQSRPESPAETSKLRSGEALFSKSNNEQSRRRSLLSISLPH
jgi:hypothetical protein